MSVVQSTPIAEQPVSAMRSSHWPPPLVNTIVGVTAPVDCAHAFEHRPDVGQRKMRIGVGGKQPAPGVEHHQRVGAVRDLLREIGGDRFGIDRQDAMQQIGARIKHAAHARKVRAAAAFDHVAGERKRAAGEPEQRQFAGQSALDRRDRVVDVAQALGIGHGELRHRLLVDQRPRETRTFAVDEMQVRDPSRRAR